MTYSLKSGHRQVKISKYYFTELCISCIRVEISEHILSLQIDEMTWLRKWFASSSYIYFVISVFVFYTINLLPSNTHSSLSLVNIKVWNNVSRLVLNLLHIFFTFLIFYYFTIKKIKNFDYNVQGQSLICSESKVCQLMSRFHTSTF